jgi:hypothetical protein
MMPRINTPTDAGLPRALGPSQKGPPILFSCVLDEQPNDLLPIPSAAQLAESKPGSGLILNPCCHFSRDGQMPMPFVGKFAPLSNTLWLLDPATDGLSPFWLGTEYLRCLADLRPGDPSPQGVPSSVASVLRYADVLVPSDYRIRRRQEWAQTVAESSAFFRQRGYVSLARLVHPFHVAALRRYYRESIAAGQFQPSDSQCPDRYSQYNEEVARFFHHQLTSAISDITGEPVQPSYVFIASYRGGAELHRHTDREQCEFTVSMCLDFVPEPSGITGWPLYLETGVGHVAMHQALGDGLLFRGRQLPHYRLPLAPDHSSTSILFHFVPCDSDAL